MKKDATVTFPPKKRRRMSVTADDISDTPVGDDSKVNCLFHFII